MTTLNDVQSHYTADTDLLGRFRKVLDDAGLGADRIDWTSLAPIDQFHVRGLEATGELAEALQAGRGDSVLDVGCGFGGPARFLAATRGCHVTGIDLTPAFIEVATMLGVRTGLADALTFVQGDALDLPFPDQSFDHAWTQHVAMNIADKGALYRGIFRALKPGGRLAIYDFVTGNGEPLTYPLPWASKPNISFVISADEIRAHLKTVGFHEVSVENKTQAANEWFANFFSRPPTPGGGPVLNLGSVLGPEVMVAARNAATDLMHGHLGLAQIVVQKD